MAKFELAIDTVLHHEGGFVNDPVDPGGATSFGVSLRFLRQSGYEMDLDGDGDTDAEDVRLMTRQDAIRVYREKFWRRIYEGLHAQTVATKLFDTCVNVGHAQGHRLFQRAIVACGQRIVIDGAVGPATVAAANRIPAQQLLESMRTEQSRFYETLVQRKPALRRFLRGWLRRAAS